MSVPCLKSQIIAMVLRVLAELTLPTSLTASLLPSLSLGPTVLTSFPKIVKFFSHLRVVFPLTCVPVFHLLKAPA